VLELSGTEDRHQENPRQAQSDDRALWLDAVKEKKGGQDWRETDQVPHREEQKDTSRAHQEKPPTARETADMKALHLQQGKRTEQDKGRDL